MFRSNNLKNLSKLSAVLFGALGLGSVSSSIKENSRSPSNVEEKDKPKLQESNWVTARIWQARDAQGRLVSSAALALGKTQDPKGENAPPTHRPRIGHASVEASQMYASFWPSEGVSLTKSIKKPGIKSPVLGQNNSSLEQDIKSEGSEATTETTFYTLNQDAMCDEFEKMVEYNLLLVKDEKIINPNLIPSKTIVLKQTDEGVIAYLYKNSKLEKEIPLKLTKEEIDALPSLANRDFLEILRSNNMPLVDQITKACGLQPNNSPRYVMKPAPLLRWLYGQHNSENCTTAAYRVLKAGGINRLSKQCAALNSQLTTLAPDDLKKCVESAKEQELRDHPETQHYRPSVRR